MPAFVDLTGQQFGSLTVLRRAPNLGRLGTDTAWFCKCACGNELAVRAGLLTGPRAQQSCGCVPQGSRLVDLTGHVFGRLTVIQREPNKGKQTRWMCRCSCDNTTIVGAELLNDGRTKSCGCSRREITGKRSARLRRKDITGTRSGLLVAVREIGRTKRGEAIWECRCDCGGSTRQLQAIIIGGRVVSCGCHKPDKQKPLQSLNARLKTRAGDHRRRARILASSGHYTRTDILRLFEAQQNLCANPYCRADLTKGYQIDHIVALSKGGSNAASNIQLLCEFCNLSKHDDDHAEWLARQFAVRSAQLGLAAETLDPCSSTAVSILQARLHAQQGGVGITTLCQSSSGSIQDSSS